MKILVFSGLHPTNEHGYGGVFMKKRLESYSKYNIDFDVYSFTYNDSIFIKALRILLRKPSFSHLPPKLNCIDFTWNFIQVKRGILCLLCKKVFLKKALSAIFKNVDIMQYDLLSVHWAYPYGYLAKLVKDKCMIPFSLTLHGSDIHTSPQKKHSIKRYTVSALNHADTCIFVSHRLRESAIKLGYRNDNSVVIPNGYDSTDFCYLDKSIAKSELDIKSRYLVGFVGNLVDIKNVLKLPDIFRHILNGMPDVEFVIIGEGELGSKVKKRILDFKLPCRFTGALNHNEVALYMQAMDAMILPSKNEGFPCVCIEARACGTYVVGSNAGGIPEAIGNKEQIIELNKDFEANISGIIVRILRTGYNPRIIAEDTKSFTWEHVTRDEVEVFKEIAKAK